MEKEATLWIQESFVNRTRGSRYGDGEPYDTGRTAAEVGKVYRECLREYGRCAGRIYVDRPDGSAQAVGWVFVKRVRYDDARPGDKDPTYLREVWITMLAAPDTVTRQRHYHDLDGAQEAQRAA